MHLSTNVGNGREISYFRNRAGGPPVYVKVRQLSEQSSVCPRGCGTPAGARAGRATPAALAKASRCTSLPMWSYPPTGRSRCSRAEQSQTLDVRPTKVRRRKFDRANECTLLLEKPCSSQHLLATASVIAQPAKCASHARMSLPPVQVHVHRSTGSTTTADTSHFGESVDCSNLLH